MGTIEKNLDKIFIAVFSVLVLTFFYLFVGANGLVLGNDPAVHLETAKYYLSTGSMPLSSILWLPPLYHLALSTFISFTGATTVDQQLFVIKAVTAVMDWLLVFSVYLLAAKFFSKKTGVIAASLLLLCFPLYELNSWGGYTSILSLAFMALMFLYLASPLKSTANAFVSFILAFSVVLSHQLATFISVFILAPFIVVVLVKSRGNVSKALIAAIVGGGIAFGIYYLQPILPYLGELVEIIFFQIQTYSFQIPSVSFDSFMMYFGFIIFFAFAGLAVAYFKLKKQKSLLFYLLLTLAFLIPVFFSQSYLVGIYLPFQWFVYYMLPALVVLAAVTFTFVLDAAFSCYSNHKQGWHRTALKLFSVVLVVALASAMVLHFQTVSGKLQESTTYYSTSDMAAYQAGAWIRQNHPDTSAQVVVSKEPGHWFWVYSGLNVTAETDPIIDWNTNAECVLDFSYEVATPLTMVRAYEAKTGVLDDVYVPLNMVWHRVAYLSMEDTFVSYRDPNGILYVHTLGSLKRTISMDTVNSPQRISINYTHPDFVLSESILVGNTSYPATVTWNLTALKDLNYAVLYLDQIFDPTLHFTQANLDGALDWSSPLDNPTNMEPNHWALTAFTDQNLQDNSCISFYDQTNQTAYAINFTDQPNLGNVGALWNQKIDALRWQYNTFKLEADRTVSYSYQVLAFSLTSYPQLKDPYAMNTLFSLPPAVPFEVQCRNFASIIRDNYVGFIVYSVERFDPKIFSSGWVQLVYSNDKYLVMKVKVDHPLPDILEA
ncbi:MAG: hypothetical protein NWF00_00655 [Candidatus Bathyarchaeota archaeon]|nr:hypothetical protein [Candidatus Bathyarchaeota archaeon]